MPSPDGCPQEPAEALASGTRNGHGAKSAAVRERAVIALLSENTISAAAQMCGLDEKTLRRWMANDEAFKQDLRRARHSSRRCRDHPSEARKRP